MTKIIFFDVDGTLLKLSHKELSEKTIYALNKLKENGIKIFIATGRPTSIAPRFKEVEFDGILSFSGQLCMNQDGILYSNHLLKEDVERVYENSLKMNIPLILADQKEMVVNYHREDIDEYLRLVNVWCEENHDFEEFMTHPIYQLIVAIKQEQEKELLEGTSTLQTVRWTPIACDIIPKVGGKEFGMKAILEHYGYTKEECMAFGDGGNDKTMLEYAGIGVAMGNAVDEVKEIADYITLSANDDGVYAALKHFDLI